MGIHVENSSFDELEPEISWIKGVSGAQTGGTPPEAFWAPPCNLEESASHHFLKEALGGSASYLGQAVNRQPGYRLRNSQSTHILMCM